MAQQDTTCIGMKDFSDGYISAHETVARNDLPTCDGRQNQDKGDEEPLRSNDQGETGQGGREKERVISQLLTAGAYCTVFFFAAVHLIGSRG